MSGQSGSRRSGDAESYGESFEVLKVPPFHYLHVLDTNANTVSVIIGPKTVTCLEHQKVVFGPAKMVIIPPRHFVVVENPILRKENPKDSLDVEIDKYGQYKLRHGDQEVRLEQDPFPLFPGEKIVGRIEPLQVVEENSALRLRAKRDFKDRYAVDARTGQLVAGGVPRRAGDEWLFKGLATYIPQAEVEIVHTVKATILKPNQALKMRAKEDCTDHEGHKRKIGEEWLVRREGAYLPDVNEHLVEVITATTLEEDTALHLRAIRNFRDAKGVDRKIGDRYMLTREDFSEYCPDVNEQITAVVRLTVLNNRQWSVIVNPVGEDGVTNELGVRRFVKGPTKFFLRPGESLESGVQDVIVLSADEAILVRARESFNDGSRTRQPGDKFFVYGPREYWPPLEADIVRRNIKAFFAVEPLNLYLFQPELVAMTGGALMLLFLIWLIFLRGGSSVNAVPNKEEL